MSHCSRLRSSIPNVLKYRSWVCCCPAVAYDLCLEAGTVRRVVVAGSAATNMLHEIHEPEVEVAASICACVSLSVL